MKIIRSRFKGIPGTIFALGFVSLFMDISSEMIHSLLPLFLVSVLGAGVTSVGFIEGVAEAAAMITKLFSGALSDWIGKRKTLAIVGYALGAATKPLFAMASGIGVVFTARFLDRVGKGIRGAPRDALVADVTRPEQRGAAYGLRQTMDTVGAFIGPLLAMILMVATAGAYRTIFWIAVIPGAIAVAVLVFAVKEPEVSRPKSLRGTLGLRHITSLGLSYWMVVAFGSVFTLARFSEAFLLLRAENVGMKAGMVPVIMIIMNIFYSLTAYPAGRLSDRLGRTGLMACGLVILIVSDLALASSKTGWQVMAGAAIWGLHMGLTQGLLSAMIADASPEDLRGTAFGVFSLASGIAVLFGSLIAGWMWDLFGPAATFYAGAIFSGCALTGFVLFRKPIIKK